MRKSDLTPARQALLDFCSELQFGRIHGFSVSAGDPIIEPRPPATQELRFGAVPLRSLDWPPDYELKDEAIQCMEHLDRLGDGTIYELTVRHGLPSKVSVIVKPNGLIDDYTLEQ